MNPVMLEWCYAREVLRRLGFSPDEIYFAALPPGGTHVDPDGTHHYYEHPLIGVEVKRGGLKFLWTIGVVEVPFAELEAMYRDACERFNAGDPVFGGELVFLSSYPAQVTRELVAALRAKGFDVQGPN
jgi:hypothetical protein